VKRTGCDAWQLKMSASNVTASVQSPPSALKHASSRY